LKITNAETNGHNPPLSVSRNFMCFVMIIKKRYTPSTVYGIVIMGKQTAICNYFCESGIIIIIIIIIVL
jgi:hypothetical protein